MPTNWNSIWHMTYLFWQSIWHTTSHIFWHSIWRIFWHSIWHSIWHIFWHSIWHSIWDIFWHSIRHSITFSLWHLALAIEVPQSPLRSGSCSWGPAVPHWALALLAEVRQCPLRSGARSWGPAAPTDVWRSRLRSGSAASSSGLSPRLPKEKEAEATLLKSRELGRVSDIPMVDSTTVLCCYRKHAGVQGACCHEDPGESRGHEGIPAKGPGARIDSAGDKQTFLDVCTMGAKSPVPARWRGFLRFLMRQSSWSNGVSWLIPNCSLVLWWFITWILGCRWLQSALKRKSMKWWNGRDWWGMARKLHVNYHTR